MRWVALAVLVVAGSARADMSLPRGAGGGAGAGSSGGAGDCGAALEAARTRAAAIEHGFASARVAHLSPDEWELRVVQHGGLYFDVLVFAYPNARATADFIGFSDEGVAHLVRDGARRRATVTVTGWDDAARKRMVAAVEPAVSVCLAAR